MGRRRSGDDFRIIWRSGFRRLRGKRIRGFADRPEKVFKTGRRGDAQTARQFGAHAERMRDPPREEDRIAHTAFMHGSVYHHAEMSLEDIEDLIFVLMDMIMRFRTRAHQALHQ